MIKHQNSKNTDNLGFRNVACTKNISHVFGVWVDIELTAISEYMYSNHKRIDRQKRDRKKDRTYMNRKGESKRDSKRDEER